MQIATGTVANGKIVLDGMPLAEGSTVTVLARGADEGFALSAAQEEALVQSLREIERGEFVTVEALLASLPKADALGQKRLKSVRETKAGKAAATTLVEPDACMQAKRHAARRLLELGGRIEWGLDPDA